MADRSILTALNGVPSVVTEAAIRGAAPLPGQILLLNETDGTAVSYATITAALAAASSGETVVIGAGDYAENVTGVSGVNLAGWPRSGVCRIIGADTTGTRLTLPTSAVTREIGVVGPSSGANPAVATPSSGTCLVQFCSFSGGGGTGPVLQASGSATLRMVATVMGGTASIGLSQATTGQCITRDCALTGTFSTASLDISGASNRTIHTNIRTFPGHSSPIGLRINAAATVEAAVCYFDTGCTVGLQFGASSDGASLNTGGGSFTGSTYDVEVVSGATGSGTVWTGSGTAFRLGAWEDGSTEDAFTANATIAVLRVDVGAEDDDTIGVFGDFAVGRPLNGAELVAGQGDSTVQGMRVFSATGASSNTADGTGFVDNTTAAKSKSGSTYPVFQGTALHNVAYFGCTAPQRTFPNVEFDHGGTAINLGAGELSWEYWNGSAWAPFFAGIARAVMSTNADFPYDSYANDVFTEATGAEQLRFAVPDDWATKAVNGVTGYWIRVRVGDLAYTGSAITTVPVLHRTKMGTNRSEINKDGFIEHFGDAAPLRTFWRAMPSNLNAPSGGANAPADTNVSFSSNITYRNVQSSWDTGDRAGAMIAEPDGLDTSRAITLIVTWLPTNTNTGNVDWNVYLAEVREGLVIGSLTEAVDTQVVAAPGVVNQVMKTTFTGILPQARPGDFFAFSLWREAASDTFTGSAVVLSLEFNGFFWK